MSISVSRESISKLMTELVDTFPMESEGRSSISDFGKLLFTEGQSGAHAASTGASATSAPASVGSTGNSTSNAPASDDEERDDEEEDDEEEDDDDEDDEQSAIEDAKIAGAPAAATAPGQKRVFTEIKGVPRQKQPDVQCVVAENGKISLSQTSMRKIMKSKDKAVPKRWTQDEDDRLREAVGRHGERNWKSIAEEVPGRNHTQCLQRWTKVLAPGLVKGHWRPDEDELLKELVAEGRKNWGQVATRIPGRTSKQCRERWYNHLDPSIVRGEYTAEEDRIILEAQSRLGNRWSAIAAMLPGRTEDAVKIRWKSLCRVRKGQGRRAAQQGGDKPRAATPKAGGGMMPPHHMLHHHPHLHAHHAHHSSGGGSFSGGPMVKSEELGAFSTATMRVQQQQHVAAQQQQQQQHMSRLQYSNALQQQQQLAMAGGGGYHVLVSPSAAHSMMYASDMGGAAMYDPNTGQYRKTPAASMGMHAGYGLSPQGSTVQDYGLDRRANAVGLATPTHHQQQSYRTAGGGGYAATSPYAGMATDMNGNVYAASGTAGGYVMTSMSPMYHARPELVSPHVSQHQQQQMMGAAYGYSAPPPTPSNGVASAFAQGLMHQQAPAYQPQANQESDTGGQEPPSPQQQQQKESAQSAGDDGANSAARGDVAKSPAKSTASASPAAPAPFNPAAMFAQSQQANAAAKQPAAMNPVAAFLQQQQKPKAAVPTPTASGAARPPFNPAAAFAQRFQGGKPPIPSGKSAAADDADDDDAESSERMGTEPSLKKVKPRLSIDAARASAARRMRNSGTGAAALAGRGSLDVFLNEIGDVGRLSDLKMDEFQTLDELWRVSDDMNRLSL